ncbi:MAG: family 10 glycosylhydrolase [Oscillospiraceae bacterium]|nr:family 10 glycosylhydrolase [Oscillospiraceae bacterium]
MIKRCFKTALTVLLTASLGLGSAVPAAAVEMPAAAPVRESLAALREASPLPADADVAASCLAPAKADEVRAIWIAFLDLQKILAGSSEEEFTSSAEEMFRTCRDAGLNTVIVQVRPYGDSFYPSDYFPWSDYASGRMGRGLDYDPLQIMVEKAHGMGLSIEAWVNPLRAMTEAQIADVSDDYPIRRWYDSDKKRAENLFITGGRIYLNPASDEVRDLIAAGVSEIAENYDVDGIHIDDYFYPSGLDFSFDAAQYNEYTEDGGKLSQGDWRRSLTSKMVKQMYGAVKAADREMVFGVSPRGINSQTYELLYADVAEWVQNPGYLDYVVPQIYYGYENSSAPYSETLKEWTELVTEEDVRLMIGLSPYKTGAADQYAGKGKEEWLLHDDIIARQINEAREYENCDGVFLFRYEQIFANPSAAMEKEKKNFIALLK